MINRRIVTGWIPEMEAVEHLLRNHVLLRNQGDVKALKHISTNFSAVIVAKRSNESVHLNNISCANQKTNLQQVWQNRDCCIVSQC